MKNKKILLANSLLLLALALFILIPIGAQILFDLQTPLGGNISLLLSGFISIVVLGGISLFYCKLTKKDFKKSMAIKKISRTQVLLIMLVSIGTYIFAVGINSISMQLFPVAIKDSEAISQLLNSSDTLLGLIIVVLVPAFFEELFFRGVLLDAYEGVNKKLKYFLLILIFATFHGNVMQIIYVLFLGFILLKVREYTGSLLGSITLHAINNGISFILSKVAMNFKEVIDNGIETGVIDSTNISTTTDAMNISFSQAMLTSAIFFLIGGAILYTNLRKLKKYKDDKEKLGVIDEKPTLVVENRFVNEENIRQDHTGNVDKKQYIPLAIYFILITTLVVFKY